MHPQKQSKYNYDKSRDQERALTTMQDEARDRESNIASYVTFIG